MVGRRAAQILERIRRCKHCGTEMTVTPLAYEENPYCTKCFDERTEAASGSGELAWRQKGHYVEFFKKGS